MSDLFDGAPVRTSGLVLNAPAVFAREDFVAWLADDDNRVLSYHPKFSFRPDEYSDTVVLVDSNYEGDASDMPEDVWRAICDAAYAAYGGPDAPARLGSHIHVRLTNLEA